MDLRKACSDVKAVLNYKTQCMFCLIFLGIFLLIQTYSGFLLFFPWNLNNLVQHSGTTVTWLNTTSPGFAFARCLQELDPHVPLTCSSRHSLSCLDSKNCFSPFPPQAGLPPPSCTGCLYQSMGLSAAWLHPLMRTLLALSSLASGVSLRLQCIRNICVVIRGPEPAGENLGFILVWSTLARSCQFSGLSVDLITATALFSVCSLLTKHFCSLCIEIKSQFPISLYLVNICWIK